eukprot:TRINITY_DN4516_c0_g1_i1.p1 TRINITY_DN4516_c0_g1~~TRINITY_DN4516_c0_g1_i1.p1  ORF type:complete len:123 (+),score=7.27 TRINITY_DN4516_c0_g1_i1:145-513(+)
MGAPTNGREPATRGGLNHGSCGTKTQMGVRGDNMATLQSCYAESKKEGAGSGGGWSFTMLAVAQLPEHMWTCWHSTSGKGECDPEEWLISGTVLLHKKGNLQMLNCDRPLSITTAIDHIYDH